MATVFKPRFNSKDMAAEFYDPNYQPSSTVGGDMANPYDMMSGNTPALRISGYLWGRWHEAAIYASGLARWDCNTGLGSVRRTATATGVVTTLYLNYTWWWDASIYNNATYTNTNLDTLGVVVGGPHLGELCFFYDSASSTWGAGICERILEDTGGNVTSYILSTWNSTLRAVQTYNVVNHVYNGVPRIGVKEDYASWYGGGMAPLQPSKPIGYKVPIWMYKKYLDRQKGLI